MAACKTNLYSPQPTSNVLTFLDEFKHFMQDRFIVSTDPGKREMAILL